MRMAPFIRVGLAVSALAAFGTCLAGIPQSTPAQNCAQALARSLHAKLQRVEQQPAYRPAPLTDWPQVHKLIVRAYGVTGLRSIPMVCSYDASGRVIALTRPSELYGRLLVNGTTPRDWPDSVILSR